MVEWPRDVYLSGYRGTVSLNVIPDPFNTNNNQGYNGNIHDCCTIMKDTCCDRNHIIPGKVSKPRYIGTFKQSALCSAQYSCTGYLRGAYYAFFVQLGTTHTLSMIHFGPCSMTEWHYGTLRLILQLVGCYMFCMLLCCIATVSYCAMVPMWYFASIPVSGS